MKNIVLKELLDSLQPYPNMRFLLFSDSWGELEEELLSFCKEHQHELQLYDASKDGIDIECDILKKRVYKESQPRYNIHGRLYDYCFIHFESESIEEFLKKIYSAVANSGRVYILLDSKDRALELEKLFYNLNFVSVSKIELDNKELYLSAKKMHGWGS